MTTPPALLCRRKAVQVAVLAVLCLLPWLNAWGWTAVMGDFYALRLGTVPFADPLTLTQALAAGSVPAWPLWQGALSTLASALVLGRFFCGWLCPYGLFSEWMWRRRKAETRHEPGVWLQRVALTAAGLAGAALWGAPLLNALSAPGLLSLVPQLTGAAAVGAALTSAAGMLALEAWTGSRWWCRALCPQALLLMVAAWCGQKLPLRMAVRRRAERCSCAPQERPCAAVCSMGLNPKSKGGPPCALCTQCGDCVTACARKGGALRLGTAGGRTPRRASSPA